MRVFVVVISAPDIDEIALVQSWPGEDTHKKSVEKTREHVKFMLEFGHWVTWEKDSEFAASLASWDGGPVDMLFCDDQFRLRIYEKEVIDA